MKSRERRSTPKSALTAAEVARVKGAYWIFETSVQAKDVLDDLAEAYYDRPSFVPGDSHATAYHEGQRSVVAAIFEILDDLKRSKSSTKPKSG